MAATPERSLERIANSLERISQTLEVFNENFVTSVKKPNDTVTVVKESEEYNKRLAERVEGYAAGGVSPNAVARSNERPGNPPHYI